jgi:hypothetical protein
MQDIIDQYKSFVFNDRHVQVDTDDTSVSAAITRACNYAVRYGEERHPPTPNYTEHYRIWFETHKLVYELNSAQLYDIGNFMHFHNLVANPGFNPYTNPNDARWVLRDIISRHRDHSMRVLYIRTSPGSSTLMPGVMINVIKTNVRANALAAIFCMNTDTHPVVELMLTHWSYSSVLFADHLGCRIDHLLAVAIDNHAIAACDVLCRLGAQFPSIINHPTSCMKQLLFSHGAPLSISTVVTVTDALWRAKQHPIQKQRAALFAAVDPYVDEINIVELIGDFICIPAHRRWIYERERSEYHSI